MSAAGVGSNGGVTGLGSSSVKSRRLTLVLPSVIEDSGDGGFSHMHIPSVSGNRVRDDDDDDDFDEAAETEEQFTARRRATRRRIGGSGAAGRMTHSTTGDFPSGNSISSPASSSPVDPQRVRNGNSSNNSATGLSKPTLSPSMIRFTPPSQYPPEGSIAVCMAPGCNVAFSFFHRRYRCKMCGKIFCFTCCSNEISTNSPVSFIPTGSPRQVGPTNFSRTPSMSNNLPDGSVDAASTQDTGTSCRVCRQCYYEAQLVLSKRQEDGELRRRCRGEFKLFQRSLLLNVFSFLTLHDLAEVSRVSSDFYFISRDNVIWYQHNMQRWIKEEESPRLNTISHSTMSWQAKQSAAAANVPFQVAPVLQDASLLSNAEAAKRAISLHARYNYTQFLDYARRLEMAQRDGLTSFMLGTRILFSTAIRLAIIGPSHVGKTAAIRAFLGEDAATMVVLPTIGFTRYTKAVALRGAVKTEVMLHIYDLSGAPRYEQLRRFICRHSHAIGLCYDPTRKFTMVEAADMMMAIEDSLGPQPVAVCGLVPPKAMPHTTSAAATAALNGAAKDGTSHRLSSSGSPAPSTSLPLASPPASPSDTPQIEVQPAEAKGITVRGRRSLHCPLLDTAEFYQELLQCLLDRIALATIEKKSDDFDGQPGEAYIEAGTSSPNTMVNRSVTKRPKADQAVARGLLNMTMQASPLDILLDS